ncbi:MAG: hypothetical protein KGM43_10640, partial [Planctomycetota bacterium]|nr:hypothetical protein [Planctomycetota bacterium]
MIPSEFVHSGRMIAASNFTKPEHDVVRAHEVPQDFGSIPKPDPFVQGTQPGPARVRKTCRSGWSSVAPSTYYPYLWVSARSRLPKKNARNCI